MIESATIAAVSTAFGQGAIAVIRMSGPECADILSRCWTGRKPAHFEPRRASLGHITDASGNCLDEALATFFPGPHSYTGEDMMEIGCHGGLLVTRRVLERLMACGAAPAAPGEFTQRAFLNQRMDLTQAEAVMDILSAQTDLALRAAHEQREGALGQKIKQQTEELIGVLAHIEAYIDFPDEDISPDTADALLGRLGTLIASLHSLLDTAEQGRMLREGVRTVLAGAPNAGKSSLLNLLLGYERAIVSETPGTTRDTLEETINVAGYPLRLIDTAGLRHSSDHIEQAGIRRTEEALSRADLVLEVVDASLPCPEKRTAFDSSGHHLLILNKSDIGLHPDWKDVPGISLSCKTGDGKEPLAAAIADCLKDPSWTDTRGALVAINARHQNCLRQAVEALEQAASGIREIQSPEFIALDLREALSCLGEITGKVDTEDVLGKIFSSFCIGK